MGAWGVADAIAAVIEACKPGAKIVDLCDVGDNFITEYVLSSLWLLVLCEHSC